MDFTTVKEITIPEGVVLKIMSGSTILWEKIRYTNQIPNSINADGTQYVGANGEDGYKNHAQLNTAGAEASTSSDVGVTGYIPVKKGDIVYFKNMQLHPTASGGKNELTYVGMYLKDFSNKACTKARMINNYSYIVGNLTTYEDTGYYKSFEIIDQYNYGISYLRFSCGFLDDTAIITVNEPID